MAWTIDVTQKYLTREQVSEIYPISGHTLARLASEKRGPVFYKPTEKALYRAEDIELWIESHAVVPSASDAEPKRPSGRGTRRAPMISAASLPKVLDVTSPKTGRQLKSLKPSPDSYLRRES